MSLLNPISQNSKCPLIYPEAIAPRFFHLMSRPERISYLAFRKKEESQKINEYIVANQALNEEERKKFLILKKRLTKEIKACHFIANKEKSWRQRVIAGDGHCFFRAFLGGFLDKLNRLPSREAREASLVPIGERLALFLAADEELQTRSVDWVKAAESDVAAAKDALHSVENAPPEQNDLQEEYALLLAKKKGKISAREAAIKAFKASLETNCNVPLQQKWNELSATLLTHLDGTVERFEALMNSSEWANSMVMFLRRMAIASVFVEDQAQAYDEFWPEILYPDETKESYFLQIRSSTRYGGQLEAIKLAELCNVQVAVVELEQVGRDVENKERDLRINPMRAINYFNEAAGGEPIKLLWTNTHYNLITEAPQEDSASEPVQRPGRLAAIDIPDSPTEAIQAAPFIRKKSFWAVLCALVKKICCAVRNFFRRAELALARSSPLHRLA